MENVNRSKIIRRTGLIGIFTNIGLGIIKIVFGLLASSFSIIADSINNFTDVLSSTVTVIGNKLAHLPPSKKHPFGYGRIEYVASFIVSGIIIATAAFALYESIQKIITPDETSYTYITIIMVSIAIVVKIALGLYTRHQAKKANSLALKGSGTDALFDALITTATLIGAIVSMIWGVKIEGYLGILISIFIAKTGIEMILETTNLLIGKRYDKEIQVKIKSIIKSFKEVNGVFDLYLNDYGPEMTLGSVHVEVPGSLTALEIDELTRNITTKVYMECGVILTVGIYADVEDEESIAIKKEVTKIILSHKEVLQVHGFHLHKDIKSMSIDVVLDYSNKKRDSFYKHVYGDLKEKFPDYDITIVPDIDTID